MKNRLDIKNKVLLFDFDGTLVETEIVAKKVIDRYFEEKNFPVSAPFADMIVGRTWKSATEIMHEHAQGLGVVLDAPEVLATELKQRYREAFMTGVRLIPGFRECLSYFQKNAKFLGIVTGSDRHEVQSILEQHGLSGAFQQIWAFGDYEHSKPDPSPYLKALSDLKTDLKVDPKEVLVFEDSKVGMESAHRAGLKFIQIAFEAHAVEPDSRAILTLKDWRELQVEP